MRAAATPKAIHFVSAFSKRETLCGRTNVPIDLITDATALVDCKRCKERMLNNPRCPGYIP